MNYIRHAVIIAVFSAMSVVGGLIKLPSFVGSVALDSAPGYFVAAFYHPILGAIVGLVGHIGSAATAGMPLGPLHLVIGVAMMFICGVFGLIARSGKSVWFLMGAAPLAILLNSVILPLVLIPFGLPQAVAFGLMPFLAFASLVNVGLASAAAWASTKFRPGA
jgi:hypothetical protein